MKKSPTNWNKAKKIISRKDPVLKKIIKKYNTGFLSSKNKPFFSICRTIVGQQISTKAADSIWLKFEKKCKKKIKPEIIIKLSSTSNILVSDENCTFPCLVFSGFAKSSPSLRGNLIENILPLFISLSKDIMPPINSMNFLLKSTGFRLNWLIFFKMLLVAY